MLSAGRLRGGAGLVFAVLGLILWRTGPGYTASAAAAGCRDSEFCYAETEERGTMGPQGMLVSSYTSTCRGDCNGGVEGESCSPITSQNPDGSTTIQCSCDPNVSPAACSGFPTTKDGTVQSFFCVGDCGIAQCRSQNYNVVTDRNCPRGYSLNRKCICE